MKLVQSGMADNLGLVGKNIRKYLATTALTATGLMAVASPALAENDWTGHQYEQGSATVDTSTPNTTNIYQNTSFVKARGDADIDAHITVNLHQGKNGKYVLFDTEADASYILGNLNADGEVYIFDQNGVVFGADSQVNVGAIVTSTGFISDANIQNNKLVFESVGGEGKIVNNGSITVAEGGLAAFVAPGVVNNGIINAKAGKVVLASGEKVTLDLYGDDLVNIEVDGELENSIIENKGTINASGGTVALTVAAAKDAVDSVINMDGAIDVSSVSVKGGKIIVNGGNKGVVNVAGKLDASGTSGGDIAITGQNVVVENTAEITADGSNGNGGSILAYGNDYAIFSGRVSARGSNGRKGGNAEISGGESVGYYGFTDLSAEDGETGTLLIDPKVLNISNFPTAGVLADILSGGNSVVNVNDQALADTLRFSNVNLWATETLNTIGDIDISTWDGLIFDGITTHDLTLAAPVINISGDIILGKGDLNIYDLAPGTSVLGFGILDVPASGVQVDVVNINGTIYKRSTVGGALTKAGDDQINSQANLVNVLSDNASVQQGVYLANDAGGGIVNVAPGYFAESVEVAKQVTLLGAKAGVNPNNPDAIRHPGIMEPESVIAPNSPGFHVTADGVVIDGFFILGADNGVHVEGADNVGIYNNIIYQSTQNGIVFEDSDNGIAGGNRIADTAGYGILFEGSSNRTAYLNAIHGAGLDGIFTVGGTGVEFTGNAVDGVATGIHVAFASNVNISGNYVDNTDGDAILADTLSGSTTINNNRIGQGAGSVINGNGIKLKSTDGGQIKGNKIANTHTDDPIGGDNASGVYLLDSSNIEVSHNDIHDVDWDGVKVKGGSNNLVKWNDIETATRIGIYGEGTDHLTVLDNKVHDSNLDNWGGITVLGGGDHTIGRNKVWNDNSSTGDDGIHVAFSDGHTKIFDNKVWNVRDDGIHVELTTGSVEIDNNDVWNVDNGIWAKSVEGLVVTDNDVDGRTGPGKGSFGIYVEDSYNAQIGGYNDGNKVEDFKTGIRVIDSASADVEHNKVDEFVDYGVWVSNSDWADVKWNDVWNGDGTGIRVYNSDHAEINDNDIWDVDGHGIQLVDSDYVDILGNDITNVGKHGIYVDPSDFVDIAYNWIHYAGWDGINVEYGNFADIWSNHVGYSGADGIDVHDNDGVEIWNNNIHDSGDNGIEVSDSYNAWIASNTIDDSHGDGIEVTDSNFADIRWNDITDSGDDGIDVDGGYGVDIVGNDIDDTGYNGIEVTNSNHVDIRWNDITGAGLDGINVYNSDWADIENNHIYGTNGGFFSNGKDGAARDGIHVVNSDFADITGNRITGGNAGFFANGGFGAGDDGIYVYNSDWADINGNEITAGTPGFLGLPGAGAGDDGIDVRNSFAADIYHNFISGVLGDGIQVRNSNYADVVGNNVRFAGDDGIDIEDSAHVDVKYNSVRFVANNGIEADDAYNIDVIGNSVRYVGDNGIYIDDSDRADIRGNHVSFTGDDGIHVEDSNWVDVDGNRVRFAGEDGIDVENANFLSITDNNVRFSNDNGIEVEDSNFILIDGNTSNDNGDAGIFVDPSNFIMISNNTANNNDVGILLDWVKGVIVTGNTIENNDIGLYARGSHNGYIRVSDNDFTDNTIGAKFESGIIDLTGPGNTFLNGEIALYFAVDGKDPTKLSLVRSGGFFGGGYTYDGAPNDTWPTTAVPTNFGGTIGEQYFEGQTVSFVHLDRNTFIDPVSGDAIWLDGSDSTYYFPLEGAAFTPSVDGLTPARLAFLESMFYHRPDGAGRGIFFFGLLPEDEELINIEQSLIFNRFNAFNGDTTGLNVRIVSLPSTGAGGAGPAPTTPGTVDGGFVFAQNPNPDDLNRIETAAGGEGQSNATSLNDIETAAGGEGEQELCWGNAVAAASGGQVTNVVYTGGFAANLNQAATCGTGF